MTHMIFMDHYGPQDYSCQVSSLGSHFWSVNWAVDLKICCVGGKVNYGQFIVKLHNFLSTSTFWTHMFHLIKFGPQFVKKFDQISKRGKMVKIRVLTMFDWSMIFDLIHDIMAWSTISWIKIQHVDLISWLKTFLKVSWLIVEIWSTNKKSIDTQKVKL